MTTERKFLRRSLFLPIVAAIASTLLVATLSLQPFTNVLPLLPLMLPWVLFITAYATFLVGSAEALLERERQRSLLLRIVEKKKAESSVIQVPQPLVVGTLLPPRTPRPNGRSLQFRVQIRSKKTGISVFSSSLGLMKLGCLPTQPTRMLASLPPALAPDGPPSRSELCLANDNPWTVLRPDAIPSDDTLPPSLNNALTTADTSLRTAKSDSESPLDASPLGGYISDPGVHGFSPDESFPSVDLAEGDQEQVNFAAASTIEELTLGEPGIFPHPIPPSLNTISHRHQNVEVPLSSSCPAETEQEDFGFLLQELPFFDFDNKSDEGGAILDDVLSTISCKPIPVLALNTNLGLSPSLASPPASAEPSHLLPHDIPLTLQPLPSPVPASPVTMSMTDLLNAPAPLHRASLSASLSSEWSGVLHLLPDYFPTWEALKRDGHLLTLSLFQMRVPEQGSGPDERLSGLSGDECDPVVLGVVAA